MASRRAAARRIAGSGGRRPLSHRHARVPDARGRHRCCLHAPARADCAGRTTRAERAAGARARNSQRSPARGWSARPQSALQRRSRLRATRARRCPRTFERARRCLAAECGSTVAAARFASARERQRAPAPGAIQRAGPRDPLTRFARSSARGRRALAARRSGVRGRRAVPRHERGRHLRRGSQPLPPARAQGARLRRSRPPSDQRS